MAGQGRTIPWNGAGRTVAAVAFFCLILAPITALPARADYLVTGPEEEPIRTEGYRIQGGLLIFSEDRDPVDVYEVVSIEARDLTQEQLEARNKAMEELRARVSELRLKEDALLDTHKSLLSEITERETLNRTELEPGQRKPFLPVLEERMRAVEKLRQDWSTLELPDISLLVPREIKALGLMSLHASVEHALRYARTGNPTSREYAWEHLRHALSFRESFHEAAGFE